MRDLAIDLVACCENRISQVEELMSSAYCATIPLDAALSEVADERSKLSSNLKDILARNCSLRKKDFSALMDRIVSDTEAKKRQVEEERRLVKAELEDYLGQYKELSSCLRQQLEGFHEGESGKDGLQATVERFKATYQQRGQAVFALLRHFQLNLESFQGEQQEINGELRQLVDKGESLRLEDLRQLKAAKAGEERKVEREQRRQDVARLLAHFKEHRQRGSRERR